MTNAEIIERIQSTLDRVNAVIKSDVDSPGLTVGMLSHREQALLATLADCMTCLRIVKHEAESKGGLSHD